MPGALGPGGQPEGEPAGPITVAAGVFAGFVLLALADACTIAIAVPLPSTGLGQRAVHHVVDAAETLGVGALLALAIGAFVRFAVLPRAAMRGLTIAAGAAIAQVTVGGNIARVAAHALGGRFMGAVHLAYLVFFGVCFGDALRVAFSLSGRPRLRFVPVALAAGVLAADEWYLADDYAGVHCVVAWSVAMVAGAALARTAERAGRAWIASRAGRIGLAATALFALFGLVYPPSNATRFELFRQPCAIAPWILATTVWRAPTVHAPVELPPSRWNEDRSSAPAIPPTAPPLLPPDAVVVLLTIDALRASAVSDPANDALLPSLAKLKRQGVVFTHASAPGAQTASSVSTLFSGRYYSERRWADHGVGDTRFLFPADDPVPYFPELLAKQGVMTANFAGLFFLAKGYGVTGGFREEKVVVKGRRHAEAGELIAPLLERLGRTERGPIFLYAHLLDPHAPYDRGHAGGTAYERYLSEVAIADAAVGQVEEALAAKFGDRWALLVSADHGEGFGEHQSYDHARTLYEELLHVPLLARSPLFPARTIDTRVGLIDLGPTILDLFGVPTPATFNGESLVPFLGGGTRTFTRPLIAEGRLRQSLTEPDGLKVIFDPRRKVVEVYDLAVDPGEKRNLFDVDPVRADRALAALRTFFAAHTRRDEGYVPPYMP